MKGQNSQSFFSPHREVDINDSRPAKWFKILHSTQILLATARLCSVASVFAPTNEAHYFTQRRFATIGETKVVDRLRGPSVGFWLASLLPATVFTQMLTVVRIPHIAAGPPGRFSMESRFAATQRRQAIDRLLDEEGRKVRKRQNSFIQPNATFHHK